MIINVISKGFVHEIKMIYIPWYSCSEGKHFELLSNLQSMFFFFFFKFLTFHLKCIAHQSLVQTFLQFIHVYSFCSLWLEESQYHLQYLKNSVCNSLQLHLHKGLICFPFSLQFQKRKFQEYFTCFDDYLQVGTTCGIQNKHTNE